MPDIVIPEEKFEEFLRSLLVRVTKVQEELVAEMRADVEASKALFHVRLEEALARRTRAAEEQLEEKARAAEEQLEEKRRAAEEATAQRARAFEDKLLAFEDEISRLRQLERLRHTAAAERGEQPQ
jgi:hypothetical protein